MQKGPGPFCDSKASSVTFCRVQWREAKASGKLRPAASLKGPRSPPGPQLTGVGGPVHNGSLPRSGWRQKQLSSQGKGTHC